MPTLAVSPDVLPAGGTAGVSITGGTPNDSVTVSIEGDEGQTSSVSVQLDGNGNGTGDWKVPSDWGSATFSAPGCTDVVRLIE